MERYRVSTPEGPLKSQQNLHNEGALTPPGFQTPHSPGFPSCYLAASPQAQLTATPVQMGLQMSEPSVF